MFNVNRYFFLGYFLAGLALIFGHTTDENRSLDMFNLKLRRGFYSTPLSRVIIVGTFNLNYQESRFVI